MHERGGERKQQRLGERRVRLGPDRTLPVRAQLDREPGRTEGSTRARHGGADEDVAGLV